MSPRAATVSRSVAAFGFGKHGADGCSALASPVPRIAGTESARIEKSPTDRALFIESRRMSFLRYSRTDSGKIHRRNDRGPHVGVAANKTLRSSVYSGEYRRTCRQVAGALPNPLTRQTIGAGKVFVSCC